MGVVEFELEEGFVGVVLLGFCDGLLEGCCPSRKMALNDEIVRMTKKTMVAKTFILDFLRTSMVISELSELKVR